LPCSAIFLPSRWRQVPLRDHFVLRVSRALALSNLRRHGHTLAVPRLVHQPLLSTPGEKFACATLPQTGYTLLLRAGTGRALPYVITKPDVVVVVCLHSWHLPDAQSRGQARRKRELERSLDLEVGVLPRRGLEVHHDDSPLRVTLDEVERADHRAVEHLAGVEVNQWHVERLLDAEDLGAWLLVPVEQIEHPAGQVEQPLLRVLLAEADGAIAGLELPVMWVIAVKGPCATRPWPRRGPPDSPRAGVSRRQLRPTAVGRLPRTVVDPDI